MRAPPPNSTTVNRLLEMPLNHLEGGEQALAALAVESCRWRLAQLAGSPRSGHRAHGSLGIVCACSWSSSVSSSSARRLTAPRRVALGLEALELALDAVCIAGRRVARASARRVDARVADASVSSAQSTIMARPTILECAGAGGLDALASALAREPSRAEPISVASSALSAPPCRLRPARVSAAISASAWASLRSVRPRPVSISCELSSRGARPGRYRVAFEAALCSSAACRLDCAAGIAFRDLRLGCAAARSCQAR